MPGVIIDQPEGIVITAALRHTPPHPADNPESHSHRRFSTGPLPALVNPYARLFRRFLISFRRGIR